MELSDLDVPLEVGDLVIDRRRTGARILARKASDLAQAAVAILDEDTTKGQLVNKLISAASAGHYATALLHELGWEEVSPGGWNPIVDVIES